MKIQVKQAGGPGFNISLPTALLCSPSLLNFGIRIGKSYVPDGTPDIPPETIRRMCSAMKEYARKHGPWELVHVESAAGDRVTITI